MERIKSRNKTEKDPTGYHLSGDGCDKEGKVVAESRDDEAEASERLTNEIDNSTRDDQPMASRLDMMVDESVGGIYPTVMHEGERNGQG
jgi:hypothetical protein